MAVTRNDFERAVCGTIVHHNDFRIVVGLVESAVNGFCQEALVVIVVDDDADKGVAHVRPARVNESCLSSPLLSTDSYDLRYPSTILTCPNRCRA